MVMMAMVYRSTAISRLGGRGKPVVALLRLLTAALCAAVLLGITVFVYSPLHKDDPASGGPCIFCAFQHLFAETAAAPIQLGFWAPITWLPVLSLFATRSSSSRRLHSGRAPPPFFSAV